MCLKILNDYEAIASSVFILQVLQIIVPWSNGISFDLHMAYDRLQRIYAKQFKVLATINKLPILIEYWKLLNMHGMQYVFQIYYSFILQ